MNDLVSHQKTLPSVDVVINSEPLLAESQESLEMGALCELSAVELITASPCFNISLIF